MTLAGPSVLDIVQHFVERWNEIKKRKVSLANIHFNCWMILTIFVKYRAEAYVCPTSTVRIC